jgi:hypothetical protein
MLVVNLNVGDTDIPCWCQGTADCSVTLDCASERGDEVRTDTVSFCVPIVAEDHYGSAPERCVFGESGGLVLPAVTER